MRRLSFAASFVLIAACHHGGGSNQPQTHNYAEWSLQKTADGCTAYDALPPNCPEGAVCNPPAPIDVQCPDGMVTPTIMVVQPMVGGECYTQPEDGTAPQQVSCPKATEE
jgi:hypothetical protein